MLTARFVAGRTGIGARAFRSYTQHTAFVDLGNTAASGTDGMYVVRRNADGITLDDPLERFLRPLITYQANLSTGAAHVERNHVVVAGQSRSEEHTSELQSLMRISYDVFCLKKK